jgi:hypothetical protein
MNNFNIYLLLALCVAALTSFGAEWKPPEGHGVRL